MPTEPDHNNIRDFDGKPIPPSTPEPTGPRHEPHEETTLQQPTGTPWEQIRYGLFAHGMARNTIPSHHENATPTGGIGIYLRFSGLTGSTLGILITLFITYMMTLALMNSSTTTWMKAIILAFIALALWLTWMFARNGWESSIIITRGIQALRTQKRTP